jgi:hypothetical protein
MAGRTLAGLGLTGFWALGEDDWKDANDTNLLVLSALVQPRVLDIVSADPGAPADGQIYFFDETHPTNANKVAIRDDGAWVYIAAFEGMTLYNVSDNTNYQFDGAVLVEMATGGGGGSGTFSGARIKNTGVVVPVVAVETDLTVAMTEVFDTGYHDAGTPGRLTVFEDGYYMVAAQLRRTASIADQFLCMIRQYDNTGTLKLQFYGGDVESTGGDAAQCVTGAVFANEGDYFVLRYFVALAGNLDAGYSWLSIVQLGAPAVAASLTTALLTDAGDYTVLAVDNARYVRLTGAPAKNINVQLESTEALPTDGEWHFRNAGAGDATLVPAGGVTINPPAGGTLVIPENGTATLKRVAADVFDLFGTTVAAP